MGEFKTNGDRLKEYHRLVLRLISGFRSFGLQKIVGQDNYKADRLAKLAASGDYQEGQTTNIRFLEAPTISFSQKARLANIEDITGSWIELIYKHVQDRELPTDK